MEGTSRPSHFFPLQNCWMGMRQGLCGCYFCLEKLFLKISPLENEKKCPRLLLLCGKRNLCALVRVMCYSGKTPLCKYSLLVVIIK